MFVIIIKLMIFCILFAIAAFYNLYIDQIDIKTAFLYRTIDQLIFVEIPKSYYNNHKRIVYKFNKALYRLEKSPWLWYKRLSSFFLEKLGFTCINANHNIFITRQGLEGPIVSNLVNNTKIMGLRDIGVITKVKIELMAMFEIVNIGLISFYLSLKVDRNHEKKTIKLSQLIYI